MDKIIEAIIDEVTKRVAEKLAENTTAMMDTLNVKIGASRIEGLRHDHIIDLDEYIDEKIYYAIKQITINCEISP